MSSVGEEIALLIKSRYPLIFYESIDEEYALTELREIARSGGLIYYWWSVTEGLRKQDSEGPYYQTAEPHKALKMVVALVESKDVPPGLYVLKDFEKYLEEPVTLRLFKDVLNCVRNRRDTVVILAPRYTIPQDIETDTAHIQGGYPSEEEIKQVIAETMRDISRHNRKICVSLDTEETHKLFRILKGLSRQQIRNVITRSVIDDGVLNINDMEAIENYKRKLFDQEGLLEFCTTEDKGSIAGFPNLKQWIAERSTSFESVDSSALPAPKGVLLMGVQGCGKSLAVKVIARELKIPLYRLDIGKLYSSYIGETEQNLRRALNIVEKLSPLCLWIDEIEKAFSGMDSRADGGVSQRVFGLFLTWMQERKAGCFLAATANDVHRLPPEFLRKGRFDEVFFVDLPDPETRKELFFIHLKKRGLNPADLEYDRLADEAVDFSGAEIEQAIIAALYRSTGSREKLASRHILRQIHETKPLAVLRKEAVESLRAWAKTRTRSV
ncbi:MAG: AAA family ATPase [Candidatus Omnitrophica bacterium]|nr:AAA family ATPase [Candidatus Omnitrophota bacterium]